MEWLFGLQTIQIPKGSWTLCGARHQVSFTELSSAHVKVDLETLRVRLHHPVRSSNWAHGWNLGARSVAHDARLPTSPSPAPGI